MRAAIDTNVLLSGLLWHGAPHLLLERVRDSSLTLVSSPVLLAELPLGSFNAIPILNPAQALQRIAGR